MNFDPIDRTNESAPSSGHDEFERLEFLPEQATDEAPEPDATSDIDFAPERETTDEPPVSFSPDAGDDPTDLSFDSTPTPDLAASTPFELFGTSLFDDIGLDDDLDGFDADDLDDDLEF